MAALVAACLAGCRSEPVRVSSYEWIDPAAEKAPFPVFPGSTVLADQTDLVRRARVLMLPKGVPAPRLIVFDTDAPIDEVAAWFAERHASPEGTPAAVRRVAGDLAADETALAPILAKLGHKYTPGVGRGACVSAEIAGGGGRPSVSLRRPWRDFVHDRVVDRTLIMISE